MDHLPTPHHLDLIEIPYLCTEEYDSRDFSFYPHRKGLNEQRMRVEGQFDGHPQVEVEAFLQTWLFFGTLHELFRAARVHVDLRHFVRLNDAKRKVLTTAKLPELIKKWREREDGIVLGDPEQKSRKGRILPVLTVVIDWIGRYGSIESRKSARLGMFQPEFWPLSPDTSLALITLGTALGQAFHLIYISNANLLGSWGNSELLHSRLLARGFCPNHVKMIQTRVAVDCQYYLSCIDRRKRQHPSCSSKKCVVQPRDHSACDVSACLADYTDEHNYRTLHMNCDCSCTFVDGIDEVNQIVLTYGVPILTWSEEKHGSGFKLRVTRYEPGMHYVAVSHIWADGLGNTKRNALPKCQLYRLQSYVDSLYRTHSNVGSPRKRSRSPKASPSSNIPTGKSKTRTKPQTDAEAELQLLELTNTWQQLSSALRDDIATLTEDTYSTSSNAKINQDATRNQHPYGFWIDTICVPRLAKHKGLRKLAIQKMPDIYRRADATLVLDSGIQSVSSLANLNEQAATIFMSSWMRRLWTLQEGSLCQRLCFQFADGPIDIDDLERNILKRDRPGKDEPQTQRNMNVNLHETMALQSLSMVLGDRKTVSDGGSPIPQGFRHITDAMSWRSTSRTEDENICLSVLMGLSNKLLGEQREKLSRTALLSEIIFFPTEIIFRNGERMSQQGYGWAPSSFLRPRDSKTREWDDKWRSPGSLSEGAGLVVTYPGFTLLPSGVAPRSTFPIIARGLQPCTWYIQLIDQNDNPTTPMSIGDDHAIVLSTKLENHAQSRRLICALLRVTPSTSPNSDIRWIQTKYICRAWISLMGEQDRLKSAEGWCGSVRDKNGVQCKQRDCEREHPVWATVLGVDQQWCIG